MSTGRATSQRSADRADRRKCSRSAAAGVRSTRYTGARAMTELANQRAATTPAATSWAAAPNDVIADRQHGLVDLAPRRRNHNNGRIGAPSITMLVSGGVGPQRGVMRSRSARTSATHYTGAAVLGVIRPQMRSSMPITDMWGDSSTNYYAVGDQIYKLYVYCVVRWLRPASIYRMEPPACGSLHRDAIWLATELSGSRRSMARRSPSSTSTGVATGDAIWGSGENDVFVVGARRDPPLRRHEHGQCDGGTDDGERSTSCLACGAHASDDVFAVGVGERRCSTTTQGVWKPR